MCIKKVLPLASSDDAASNSDANYIYYIGIGTWYFLYGDFGYQKVLLPASSDDAASNSDTKFAKQIGIGIRYF